MLRGGLGDDVELLPGEVCSDVIDPHIVCRSLASFFVCVGTLAIAAGEDDGRVAVKVMEVV